MPWAQCQNQRAMVNSRCSRGWWDREFPKLYIKKHGVKPKMNQDRGLRSKKQIENQSQGVCGLGNQDVREKRSSWNRSTGRPVLTGPLIGKWTELGFLCTLSPTHPAPPKMKVSEVSSQGGICTKEVGRMRLRLDRTLAIRAVTSIYCSPTVCQTLRGCFIWQLSC